MKDIRDELQGKLSESEQKLLRGSKLSNSEERLAQKLVEDLAKELARELKARGTFLENALGAGTKVERHSIKDSKLEITSIAAEDIYIREGKKL